MCCHGTREQRLRFQSCLRHARALLPRAFVPTPLHCFCMVASDNIPKRPRGERVEAPEGADFRGFNPFAAFGLGGDNTAVNISFGVGFPFFNMHFGSNSPFWGGDAGAARTAAGGEWVPDTGGVRACPTGRYVLSCVHHLLLSRISPESARQLEVLELPSVSH